mgnify:CR=1 FL=1
MGKGGVVTASFKSVRLEKEMEKGKEREKGKEKGREREK